MRALLLSLSLVLAGCRVPATLPSVPYGAQRTMPAVDVPSQVRRLHDSITGAVGLPPLADTPIPDGYREIRLSSGHGMVAGWEYPMLRLIEGPEGVAGELLLFRVRLDPPSGTQRWLVRRIGRPPADDWPAWLQRLDSLEVNRPPAGRESRHVFDAGHLIVEVRRGGAYLAYEVNAPARRHDLEGQRAAAIERILDEAAKVIRP